MTDRRMLTLLAAIPSTEPCAFSEFVGALGDDRPDDKRGWWELFRDLEDLEDSGLAEIDRGGSHINSLVLTELGAARARQARIESEV